MCDAPAPPSGPFSAIIARRLSIVGSHGQIDDSTIFDLTEDIVSKSRKPVGSADPDPKRLLGEVI
jgi:hypothetical protein